MNKTLILKDVQGNAVGFVQQRGSAVECRIKTKEQDRILLFLDSGDPLDCDVREGEREFLFDAGDGTIASAAVLFHDRCVADSGDRARTRLWAYLSHQSKRRREERKIEEIGIKNAQGYVQATEAKDHPTLQRAIMQRQWPPNPCCPELPAQEIDLPSKIVQP